MRHFADVIAAFDMADKAPFVQVPEPAADVPAGLEATPRRLINAQAYFLLMFAQLEVEINRLCSGLIQRMKDQADWRDRRAWDELEHQPERIRSVGMMRKVALLTDKRGAVYRRIKELYETRNRIAHGNLLTEEFDVGDIAEEIRVIAAELNEAS